MSDHLTFDVSEETLRSLLCQAISDKNLEYFNRLVAGGAAPLKRYPYQPPEHIFYTDENNLSYFYDDEEEYIYMSGIKDKKEDSLLVKAINAKSFDIAHAILDLGEDVNFIGISGLPAISLWVNNEPRTTHPLSQNATPIDPDEFIKWEQLGWRLLTAGADTLLGRDGKRNGLGCAKRLAENNKENGGDGFSHQIFQRWHAEQEFLKIHTKTAPALNNRRLGNRL